MCAGTSEHYCACLVALAAIELDDLVLTNHDLLDRSACTENGALGIVESGKDIRAKDGRESLNTIEISMLNNHNTGFSKKLLRVVIDQLSVDEDIGAVSQDSVNLGLHLLLLSLLDLSNSGHGVDLYLGSHDLNFIVIHGSVGDENARVLNTTCTSSSNLLLKDHTFGEERVREGATRLLDDLDVVEVAGALESKDSLDGKLSESPSIVKKKLGAESGHRNIAQVLFESLLIL